MSGERIGIIVRYYADHTDENLVDRAPIKDPDFEMNQNPVWAICEPIIRSQLIRGSHVFFVPSLRSCYLAGLSDYVCTGYMRVQEIIPSSKELLEDKRLSRDYKKAYRKNLEKHLKSDRRHIKTLRGWNIALGSEEDSEWFGRTGKPIKPLLNKIGRDDISAFKGLNNALPRLTYDESLELVSLLH